eukprot:TRINITY_DN67517_c2_g1_i2.p1 TRINITY_DN67517_c2_g1~~TRINITY_DN67517_c2_g1_i2.p1  ORF type:complete len:181 (+),score=36.92 TRINITY_DN67517_c2_g1_i2:87-629(+)
MSWFQLVVVLGLTLTAVGNFMNYRTREQRDEEMAEMKAMQKRKEEQVAEKRRLKWECGGKECIFLAVEGKPKVKHHLSRKSMTVGELKFVFEQEFGLTATKLELSYDKTVLPSDKKTLEAAGVAIGKSVWATQLTDEEAKLRAQQKAKKAAAKKKKKAAKKKAKDTEAEERRLAGEDDEF